MKYDSKNFWIIPPFWILARADIH